VVSDDGKSLDLLSDVKNVVTMVDVTIVVIVIVWSDAETLI